MSRTPYPQEPGKPYETNRARSRDIEFGYHTVLGHSEIPPEPIRFIEALQRIPFEQFGEVLRLLVEWNNTEDAKWAGGKKK